MSIRKKAVTENIEEQILSIFNSQELSQKKLQDNLESLEGIPTITNQRKWGAQRLFISQVYSKNVHYRARLSP